VFIPSLIEGNTYIIFGRHSDLGGKNERENALFFYILARIQRGEWEKAAEDWIRLEVDARVGKSILYSSRTFLSHSSAPFSLQRFLTGFPFSSTYLSLASPFGRKGKFSFTLVVSI
jgi:hypothetical protein